MIVCVRDSGPDDRKDVQETGFFRNRDLIWVL